MHKGRRFEIDDHSSIPLHELLKQLPRQNHNENSIFSTSTENLQILEEIDYDNAEGVSNVPFEASSKSGSLNRRHRLVFPRSPSPQIGNKIGLKFGKNKRKCKCKIKMNSYLHTDIYFGCMKSNVNFDKCLISHYCRSYGKNLISPSVD